MPQELKVKQPIHQMVQPQQTQPQIPQALQQTPVQPKGPGKIEQMKLSGVDPNLILETPPPKRFEQQNSATQNTVSLLGKRAASQIYKAPVKKTSKHIQCTYVSSHSGLISAGFTDEGLNSTKDAYIFSGYAPTDYIRAILTTPQLVNKIRIGIPEFQQNVNRKLKKVNNATVQICKAGDLEDAANWVTVGRIEVTEEKQFCEISIKTEVKAIQVIHSDTMGPGDSIGVGQFAVLKN